jgi:hypothetical protein
LVNLESISLRFGGELIELKIKFKTMNKLFLSISIIFFSCKSIENNTEIEPTKDSNKFTWINNDFLKIESESTKSILGEWKIIKKGDKNFIENASNDAFLEFQGNAPDTGNPNSPLVYEFIASQDGNYRLLMMCSKRLEGEPGDRCNDAWVKLEGDYETATTLPKSDLLSYLKYFQEGSTKTPELSWNWGIRAEKGTHTFFNLIYKFKKGEKYKLTVAGRSQRFSFDYFVFYNNDKMTLAEAMVFKE